MAKAGLLTTADAATVQAATRTAEGGVRVLLHAKPKSRQERLETHGGRLQLRVSSPPVDGKANERIVALLAALLDMPKSALEIVRGQSAREKEIHVAGASLDEVRSRLIG